MKPQPEQPKKKPIICGTDFSATAVEAVDIAAAIARQLGTKLILVHVDEFHGGLAADPIVFEGALLQKRRELDRAVTRLRKLGTDVEEKLLSGSPFDELVTAAVEAKARLVVLGAVGHGLPRRLLLGSVAERTAETSPIPTLVIRPGGRIASWIRGEHPLKVLISYDFSVAGDAALYWLNELQAIGEFSVIVAHILSPNAPHHTEQELHDRAAKMMAPGQLAVQVLPSWGNCEGALFETAAREDIDLVVVGTHQRQGFERIRLGSVSRAVLRHATRSVAVIPAPEHQSADMSSGGQKSVQKEAN